MRQAIAPDSGFEIVSVGGQSALADSSARSLSLKEAWAAAYRSRLWIVGIMAACIGIAIMYSLLATRLYKSEVSIEVRQEAEKVLGTEADREGSSSKLDADRFLQTQLEILRSRGTADAVAKSLGLYRGNTFLDSMKEEPIESGTLNQSPQQVHQAQVQSVLMRRVKIAYSGNTRIAELTFESPSPRLSAQIADAYADAFVRGNLARKFDSSSYAIDFLRGQLAESQRRLQGSERAVLDYSRRTRIVDASNAAGGASGSGGSLLTGQLISLNQSYATAVAARIEAEKRWQRAQEIPDLKVPEVMANPAVQAALGSRAAAEAGYRQAEATHGPNFPGVLEAKAQSSEMTRQVGNLARTVRDSMRSQFEFAMSRERELERKLEQLKTGTLSEQGRGIELSILRRDADTNRQQYDALLRRYASLNAEAGVQTNNLSIIDRAQVNEAPSWPKLPLILAIAIFCGIALSGLLVIVREQLFDAVRLPDDITDRLNLPLLGSVPRAPDIATELKDPKSTASEAYNSIRTALSFSEQGMPKTLVFTSSQASEGKSSACHGLALSLARASKTVLIIDADLRRPNAHRLFGLSNSVGVSSVLTEQSTAGAAIQQTSVPQIDVLAAGPIPPNPSELIGSAVFGRLVEGILDQYDVILIDSAPVLGLADAIILGNQAEGTLFVIEASRNTVRGASRAISRLQAGGGRIVGAVLAKYDPGQLGYGYGDEYDYNYRYGE